jgi:LysR family transcriptional regulator, transcription activator of glutamate synthase operon
MRVKDLEWILQLAETGHVTDAAAVLRTSQPTLSRTLARVEEELGADVFVRTHEGVHPTPVGELVLEAARELTDRYARLREEVAALQDPDAGVVRLAFLDSISTYLVPTLLRDFHAHAPATRVTLRQEPAHEMLADLDAGVVDLAVTSFDVDSRFAWHPLQEERLVVIVRTGHRLAHRKRLRLADLEDEELITTPVGFGYRRLVDGLFREAGVAIPVSFESQDLATMEGLVAAGLGVAIVPEPFAGLSGTVGIALSARGARRTVGLAWVRDRSMSPPAQRFRDFVVGGGSSATAAATGRRTTPAAPGAPRPAAASRGPGRR